MKPIRFLVFAVFLITFCQTAIPVYGQLGTLFNIKKPEGYEERDLKSEKSDQKKFTLPRRFLQNTFTHYNYFFNANNKLNEIIERAKAANKDDYSLLLPFYNYSLDVTAKDTIQLDSVQYKTQTGIALHDLRSDWADNLYLLWGAAFYLKKQFDSAYLMFQFINYAFAQKEKDGYYKTIGSGMDGNNAFSISTKEKRSLPKKIFSEPPSRNDAFIWQIRNFLADDQFAEAASLIVTLRNDPHFPKRLNTDLNEVQAYWFYKQKMWDSSAAYLVKSLDNASNRQEKARWEYLAAQLFELSGNYKNAEKYYAKSISHTIDPVLDIYARLNSIKVNKDEKENTIGKNIAKLLKMAKRDKYQDYRDIIYFMAAQMELERDNTEGTYALLQKSIKYNSGEASLRNKSFLQLADIAYHKKKYRSAYNFYDSLNMNDPALTDVPGITLRKEMLGRLANALEIIERQDSLQKIASMPENDRKDFVKKLIRTIRKQQGLKGDGSVPPPSPFGHTNDIPFNFAGNEPKGEWYFYNTAIRTRGANEFKSKWGNRSNVDNWRRVSSTGSSLQNNTTQNTGGQKTTGKGPSSGTEANFDSLYNNLPLTPEKLQASNDSIQDAMYDLGNTYIREAEDCNAGTETLEQLRSRYPLFSKMDEVLFNLYYCYNKTGETAKATQIKKLMEEKFPQSNFTSIVTTGKNPKALTANPEATKRYEDIYDLFIEGKFAEALAQKKLADSTFGKNYWTPQLLYIEAVYHIKQSEDSIATKVLNSIISQFPGTPLATKATNLINVLQHRNEIEEELRNLVINMPKDESKKVNSVINTTPPVTNNNKPITDTTSQLPKSIVSPYRHTPDVAHYVVLVLTKVDPVFVNEAKNAFFRYNRETFSNKLMSTELYTLDADNKLLLISPFTNAQDAVSYVDRTKPVTATEIIPWLKGGRFSFSVITEKNLDLLKAGKDLENYKNFINPYFPGKF